jgi:Transglutaminase-like superfamily
MPHFRTWKKHSARQKWLLFCAFSLSGYCYFLFRFFQNKAFFWRETTQPRPADAQLVADIRWAIRVAHRYASWPNVCRHQAYQAMVLCHFYGVSYQIFVGFKKNDLSGQVEGHAWTLAGEEWITGFCNPQEYVVQGTYGVC